MLGFLPSLYQDGMQFMPDNAPIPKARRAIACFRENGIEILAWPPANSPSATLLVLVLYYGFVAHRLHHNPLQAPKATFDRWLTQGNSRRMEHHYHYRSGGSLLLPRAATLLP